MIMTFEHEEIADLMIYITLLRKWEFQISLLISEDLTKLRYRHCIYIKAYTGYSSEDHSKSLCINLKEVQIKEAVFSKTCVTEAKRSISNPLVIYGCCGKMRIP